MTAHAQGSEIQKASPSGAAALASLVWLDWRRAVMPQERLCIARPREQGHQGWWRGLTGAVSQSTIRVAGVCWPSGVASGSQQSPARGGGIPGLPWS